MKKQENTMRKAASRVTRRRGTGIPRNAIDPESPKGTHRTIAIIATGGTFLCSHAIVPKAPRYFKTLEDFIAGSKLQEYFEQLGLYKRDDKYFLPDGTEVVYKSTDPSIDSTNATYKERHSGATLIRELQNVHPEVDVLFIHGTDTAPQTAQFFDLQFGREAGIGIAVVTSQIPMLMDNLERLSKPFMKKCFPMFSSPPMAEARYIRASSPRAPTPHQEFIQAI